VFGLSSVAYCMEAARFSSLGEKRFPGNDITMTMATTYLKMCRDDLRIQ